MSSDALPFAARAALAAVLMGATDYAWSRCVAHVSAARPVAAASWGVAIHLASAGVVLAYVADPWLLPFTAAGGWVGTWLGVRR